MKKIIEYYCDACEHGLVKETTTVVKNRVSIKFGKCNKCKKAFGLKSVQGLRVNNVIIKNKEIK